MGTTSSKPLKIHICHTSCRYSGGEDTVMNLEVDCRLLLENHESAVGGSSAKPGTGGRP